MQNKEIEVLRAALDKLGVEYDGRWGVPKLEEALELATAGQEDASNKAPEPEKQADAAPVDAAEEDESEDEPVAYDWDVFDRFGNFVRTYTLEIHGERAGELADMFAGKIGGERKPRVE